ncbi:unnamed protein product [Amaranthus hypochondriacus]
MTVNDKEKMKKKHGLEQGTHIIGKPPPVHDLQNLWQHVFFVQSTNNNNKEDEATDDDNTMNIPSITREAEGNASRPTRKKMVWTIQLHKKFLDAIKVLGLSRAVPKKILEFMNEPGLTREHVASHLQKYRLYLKQICEGKASDQDGMPYNWNQRPYRSGFTWTQFPTLAQNSYLLNYASALSLSKVSPSKTKKKINANTKVRHNSNNKPTYELGSSSSSQGFSTWFNNTNTLDHPMTRSENLMQPFILESCLVEEQNQNQINFRDDNGLEGFVAPRMSNVAQPQYGYSNVAGSSSAQAQIDGRFGRSYGGFIGNEMYSYYNNMLLQPQQSLADVAPHPYLVNNFVGNMKNFVAQSDLYMTGIPNYVSQQLTPMGNIYNFGGQHSQHGPSITNMYDFVGQSEYVNMGNYCGQPGVGFSMTNMYNFGAQPDAYNFAQMPYFGEQQPPYVHNMFNFMQQHHPLVGDKTKLQPHMSSMSDFLGKSHVDDGVMNTDSNEIMEQELEPTILVENMSNLNISTICKEVETSHSMVDNVSLNVDRPQHINSNDNNPSTQQVVVENQGRHTINSGSNNEL